MKSTPVDHTRVPADAIAERAAELLIEHRDTRRRGRIAAPRQPVGVECDPARRYGAEARAQVSALDTLLEHHPAP